VTKVTKKKIRTLQEKQHRFFKAKAIKFNRKLDRMGQDAVKSPLFDNLMIEGRALVTFMMIDNLSRELEK